MQGFENFRFVLTNPNNKNRLNLGGKESKNHEMSSAETAWFVHEYYMIHLQILEVLPCGVHSLP